MRITRQRPPDTAARIPPWAFPCASDRWRPPAAVEDGADQAAPPSRRRLAVRWVVSRMFRPRWNMPSGVGRGVRFTRSTQRGSAMLIVLVLLACMVIIAFSNIDTLASLKQEIGLIERQQQQRHEQSPGH